MSSILSVLRLILDFIVTLIRPSSLPRMPIGADEPSPEHPGGPPVVDVTPPGDEDQPSDVQSDRTPTPPTTTTPPLSPVEGPTEALRKNRAAAVARAVRITQILSVYKLGAGGRNPKNPTPFTVRDGVLGSDCIGFVLWCLGLDRYQPSLFPYYEGWINTDSAIMDAKGKKSFFEIVTVPEPGDLVIFPSLRDKNGKMTRMGHVGILTEVPADWPSDWSWTRSDRKLWLLKLQQIDCNASKARKNSGHAVDEDTVATNWNKPDAVFVRLKRLV